MGTTVETEGLIGVPEHPGDFARDLTGRVSALSGHAEDGADGDEGAEVVDRQLDAREDIKEVDILPHQPVTDPSEGADFDGRGGNVLTITAITDHSTHPICALDRGTKRGLFYGTRSTVLPVRAICAVLTVTDVCVCPIEARKLVTALSVFLDGTQRLGHLLGLKTNLLTRLPVPLRPLLAGDGVAVLVPTPETGAVRGTAEGGGEGAAFTPADAVVAIVAGLLGLRVGGEEEGNNDHESETNHGVSPCPARCAGRNGLCNLSCRGRRLPRGTPRLFLLATEMAILIPFPEGRGLKWQFWLKLATICPFKNNDSIYHFLTILSSVYMQTQKDPGIFTQVFYRKDYLLLKPM